MVFRLLYFTVFFLLTACTSHLIHLSPDASPGERELEIARILGSSLQSIRVLDEDVPRFLEAMEDPHSPQTRQVAIRLLSLKPRADIYQAISLRLQDTNADVRKEALFALLRAGSEFRNILFDAATKPGIYTTDRQALIGRISQFGASGEQLLIQLLAEDDLSVARIAAKNLKRLYPDYPNKPLSQLLTQHIESTEFSASAWLASYSEPAAVQHQLQLTISAYPKVRRRARLLYQESGDWIVKPTIALLKKNTFPQSAIREQMIQKLIEKNSEAALDYLEEFFAYPTNIETDQQIGLFLLFYRAPAFAVLQKSFTSANPAVREKSLSLAMDIVDKKTILASIPLLNDSNKNISELAKKYLQKYVGRFADDLAAAFNPQENRHSDRVLFNILLSEGVPALLWHPYEQKIDPSRLFYTFQYATKPQFLEYLKKIKNLVYILELRLIYDFYQQAKTFQSLLAGYRSLKIIQNSENVAKAGLNQENLKNQKEDNQLIRALRIWYQAKKNSSEPDLQQLQKYKNETSSLYEQYLGIQSEYRGIAKEILMKIGLDIEYLRGVSTYVPRA